MNSLNAIYLDNGVIEIHPIREKELKNEKRFLDDIFEIFGNPTSLPYNKEKVVNNRGQLELYPMEVIAGYEKQSHFNHFLTLKEITKTIGVVIIHSPKTTNVAYNFTNTWLVEFYLHNQLRNRGIMTGIIKSIVSNLQQQGKQNIGALVNRDNIPSIRVLEKSGFRNIKKHDLKQDFYQV